MSGRPHVLLVDNYDSVTYNLAHLFEELGAEVTVLRTDAVDADAAEALEPTHLGISPEARATPPARLKKRAPEKLVRAPSSRPRGPRRRSLGRRSS